ncbi:MAG: hypothetical protein EPO09_17390 [Aquabacterium sp.]|uniref:TniQ family protein n=1 Tax=Aquabacterium sp. TaxID=1872578 RepID=UPI0011F5CE62|nr:TniQ family protein [Aquabacterium sp.]TAK89405.1 MAG: hypothetical protein EPO09_17390 [Aquabacterium sp.]
MIPTFPKDATIASIELACWRASRIPDVTPAIRSMAGGAGSLQSRFGYRAATLSRTVLNGTTSPETILEKHSMFPLIAALASTQVVPLWRNAIANGNDAARLRYLPVLHQWVKPSRRLRLCRSCVLSDLETHGTGHWRVVHQVPAIRFCHQHDEVLHDECADCGSAFGGKDKWALPSDPCGHCGSLNSRSSLSPLKSDGYNALADLTVRALNGQAPELEPEIRAALLRHIIQLAQTDAETLLDQFLDWWAVNDLAELKNLLQTTICPKTTTRLFREGNAPVSAQLWMAITAFAWEHTADAGRCALLMHQYPNTRDLFDPSTTPLRGSEFRTELAEIVRRHNLPPELTGLLISGQVRLGHLLAGGANVLMVIDSLSSHALSQLTAHVRLRGGSL